MRDTAKAAYITTIALLGAALIAPSIATSSQQAPRVALRDGTAGFVISHIGLALAPGGGGDAGCPSGVTTGYDNVGEIFSPRLTGPEAERPATLEAALPQVFASTTPNLCQNPELGAPDPRWRSVVGARVPADGIDLDGQNSRANGPAAPGTCAHADFPGLNGERGIDNQALRVLGCTRAFQSTERFNGSDAEMLTGSWGILITLAGVDDIRNDADVEVRLLANADPIQLSASRAALSNATYAAEQDPRFRASAHGRIVNGVLTTEPVDMQWHWIVNSIRLDRILKHARVRLTFQEDGSLDGFLGGYTPVEAAYDANYGFRNGRDGAGEPSPLRLRTVSSIGQARVLGHTCEGAYYAMHALADGDRDPATGDCTSISTQYRIRAIPAYVVQQQSQSVNEDLAHTNDPNDTRARNGY